ncbi:MAG: tail fiber domain-containing protein [Minisyncoccota bacterium]
MKKILLILGIAILIVSTNELYAWTEPTVAPPGGSVLAPLRLDTSGFLVLPAASRIGIGLTPTYGVDVSGTVRASSAVMTPLLRPTTGSLNISGSGWGMIFSIDTDANSPDIYSFLSDGTEIMSLAGSGTSALELTSTGPASLTINADTDNVTETDNASVIFRQDAGAVIGRVGFRSNTNSFEVINQYAESLHLGTANNIVTTINAAGSMGIGTANPAYRLDVVGDINATGCLRVDGVCMTAGGGGTVGGSGTTARIPLWSNGTTLGDSILYQSGTHVGKTGSWKLTDSWGPSTLVVKTNSWDGSSNNEYGDIVGGHYYSYGGINSGGPTGSEGGAGELYVAGESNLMGNVGVGTTNPTYRLDVVGGSMGVHGSLSNAYLNSAGNQLVFERPGANFINASSVGGYFDFIVDGDTTSDTEAALRIHANRSVVIPNGLLMVTDGTYNTTVGPTSISSRGVSAVYSGVLGVNYNGAGVQGSAHGASYQGVYGSNSNSSGYGIWCQSGRCGGNQAWTNASDVRLKENIKTITSGLEKVLQLRGVQYEWKKDDTNKKNIGFIAQEVMEVVPEVVVQNSDGYYSVSESSMNAVLVEAIKELKAENDDLRERLEKLEDKIK